MNLPTKFSTAKIPAKCIIAALAVAAGGSNNIKAATDTWNTTSTTAAYLTATNWTGGVPGASDVGLFNNAGTNAGINYNGSPTGTSLGTIGGVTYGKNQAVGTIEVGSGDTAGSLTIGNSSSTANASTLNCTFTLDGTTVGSAANVVLQDASSSAALNLAGFASGVTTGNAMSVNLGDTTNNVVLIDGGSNINISANIISPVASAQLTLSRSASSTGTGALVLSGANTYTGGTTVANGNLVVTNTSGSGTGTGAVAVGTTTVATGTAGGGNAVLSGTGTTTGLVTTTAPASGTATIAPGVNSNTTNFSASGTTGVGTLTLSGGLNAGSGTNFNFDLASTATGTSDLVSLSGSGTTRVLTLGSTLTFNYNLLTSGNLGNTAYTLISGATNTLSLSGVSITSTGLGGYTPTYSVSGGSLFVTFSSSSSPNYFGTTGQGYNGNSTVFDTTTADFNTKNDGSGTAKVFDPSRTAIFAGTSGMVTVGSAGVSPQAGLEFDSGGYTLTGSTITLVTTPTVTVTNSTDTATINSMIAGSAGLTKLGAGTLVLSSTTNSFTGGVAVNAGTLSVSADGNLGSTANAVTLSGGTLATTASFSTARALSGSGSIGVASGTILADTGTVSTTALSLTGAGTLDLQSTTPSLGALTIAAPGTLASSTGGTITLTSLAAPALTGTATVSAALSFTSLTANVGAGGDVTLSGTLTTSSGTSSLTKTGAGSLDLTGSNTNLYRVQIGNASTSSPVAGGTVNINNPNALGKSQLYLDNGTLNATTDLTGTNAIPNGVSISGIVGSTSGGVAYGTATLSGSNMTFAGASNFYEVASNTVLATVNNTTTLSGAIAPGGSTTGLGILINSTNNGSLVISGAGNTFIDPITISGSATLNAANTGALALNPSITVNAGGTLLLSGTNTNRINDNAAIILAGGTYASGGNSETTGALTLSGNSSLDFGAGSNSSVLTFADSSTKTWSATLSLLNYTDTADALNFGTSTTTGTGGGLTAGQLGEIMYSSGGLTYVGTGFDGSGDVTFTMIPEPATVLGGLLMVGAIAFNQRRRFGRLAGWRQTRRVA